MRPQSYGLQGDIDLVRFPATVERREVSATFRLTARTKALQLAIAASSVTVLAAHRLQDPVRQR